MFSQKKNVRLSVLYKIFKFEYFLSSFDYISGIKLEGVRVARFLPVRANCGFVIILGIVLVG